MKRTIKIEPEITINQYTKIVQFMLEHRKYTQIHTDENVHVYEAAQDSKFGGHLLHFPLNECFCNGIPYAIVPLKGANVDTKKIGKYVNKVLNSVFN